MTSAPEGSGRGYTFLADQSYDIVFADELRSSPVDVWTRGAVGAMGDGECHKMGCLPEGLPSSRHAVPIGENVRDATT